MCCGRGLANGAAGATGARRYGAEAAPQRTDTSYLEIPDMKLPDDSLALSAQSRAECELACLENCSCQANTFSGRGGCVPVWHDGFHNLEQMYADDTAAVEDPRLHGDGAPGTTAPRNTDMLCCRAANVFTAVQLKS
jgi:hypothetical protein